MVTLENMMIIIYDRDHIRGAVYIRVTTRRRVHLNNGSAASYQTTTAGGARRVTAFGIRHHF